MNKPEYIYKPEDIYKYEYKAEDIYKSEDKPEDIQKSEENKEGDLPSFSFNNLYPNMNQDDNEDKNNNKEKDIINSEKEDKIRELPKKEVISIEKDNDIDDTSTLVNFFQDIKKIAEDKGIQIEKNPNNFTLFDDASEIEVK